MLNGQDEDHLRYGLAPRSVLDGCMHQASHAVSRIGESVLLIINARCKKAHGRKRTSANQVKSPEWLMGVRACVRACLSHRTASLVYVYVERD